MVAAVVFVALPARTVGAQTEPEVVSGVLVQTIEASTWVPASPDTSGITYLPDRDRLFVSDSEVEEETGAGYHGVNLWEITADGTVTDTGTTYPAFSAEPTGVAYRPPDAQMPAGALLVSDDNADEITFVEAGADGRFGTDDDVRSTIDTRAATGGAGNDPEGVAWDSAAGAVFFVDGVDTDVWRAGPGPDATFGTADDAWSVFDMAQYGARDPEGIDYDPATDTLWVLDQRAKAAYELTTAGTLVRTVDLSGVGMSRAAGITIAPGSVHPDRRNLWIADRGVDNGKDPGENDGKIYEVSFDTSGNTAPVVDAVTIDQQSPMTNEILTVTVVAHDDDGDPLEYRYQWRTNGTQIPGETNPTFDLSVAGNGDKGDAISVRVVAFDGIVESSPRTSGQVTVVNSPPVVDEVTIEPSAPVTDDVLVPTVVVHDDDGDPIGLTYQWTKNAADLAGETGSTLDLAVAGNGDKGDAITTRVTALDGTDTSAPVESSPVTVLNSAPVADAGADQEVGSSQDFTLDGSATTDADGDALQYLWTQLSGPAAVIREPESAVTEVEGVTGPATLEFRITATDGDGASHSDDVIVTVRAPK